MHDTRISMTSVTKKVDHLQNVPSTDHVHLKTYYNRSSYHSHKLNNKYLDYLHAMQQFVRQPLNRQNARIKNGWDKHRLNEPKWNYLHDIYPALRMRRHISIGHGKAMNTSLIHPDVEQHLNHHRDTRFHLYKSIEKYLNA